MAFERRLSRFLHIGERGTRSQRNDMDSLVAQQSRYYRELEDIQSGVRAQADHPHHPIEALRSGLAHGWRQLRKHARRIDPTS